jgi:Na+-translocating ferredoxin:NAD+ oxidoreductase RnfC subunit
MDDLSKKELLNKIKNAGVVGAGGAGFPTHIKLNTKAKIIIANGIECEPLIQTDQTLISLYSKQIIQSLHIIMQITQANKGIIALKKKYSSSIKAIENEINEFDHIELKLVDDYYPMGDEQTLIYNTLNKVIPEGSIPGNYGIIVQNICTLFNIYQAFNNIPVTEKYITITGEVEKPQIIKTIIGTPIIEILKKIHLETEEYAIIANGPIMGNIIDPKYTTVTKTLSSLIILPKSHILIRKRSEKLKKSIKLAKSLCIQCNDCTTKCPRNALGHQIKPNILMKKISFGDDFIDDNFTDAYLCCECGICSYYACPMELKPHEVIKHIKQILFQKSLKIKSNPMNSKISHFYKNRLIPSENIIRKLNLLKYYQKSVSINNSIIIPNKVKIFLQQHKGSLAKPIVKEGAFIKKDQLIADIKANKLGAKIHSPISGKVIRVSKIYIEIEK